MCNVFYLGWVKKLVTMTVELLSVSFCKSFTICIPIPHNIVLKINH